MSKDPLAETSTTPGFVQVTIKGGPYNRTEIVVNRPTWEEAAPELALMIQEVPKAQVSLDQSIEAAGAATKAPAKGTHGKPANADNPTNVDLPFAEAEETSPENCKVAGLPNHKLISAGGRKGWVCSLPKGDSSRCETVFV